jgi:hypothetical protein
MKYRYRVWENRYGRWGWEVQRSHHEFKGAAVWEHVDGYDVGVHDHADAVKIALGVIKEEQNIGAAVWKVTS